jgi:hypothetical protein
MPARPPVGVDLHDRDHRFDHSLSRRQRAGVESAGRLSLSGIASSEAGWGGGHGQLSTNHDEVEIGGAVRELSGLYFNIELRLG